MIINSLSNKIRPTRAPETNLNVNEIGSEHSFAPKQWRMPTLPLHNVAAACTLVLNSCCLALLMEDVMSFHFLGLPLHKH